MNFTSVKTRLSFGFVAVAMASTAGAQISNVASDLVYNNLEEGYHGSNQFGWQHQFDVESNPPTAFLDSPLADYTFTGPSGGVGECKASSEVASTFGSTATTADIIASGFASAEINSLDGADNFWSTASGGVDLFLDLTTKAEVTFNIQSFATTGAAGCQFGVDNTYVGDFWSGGNQSASVLIGPGHHDLFMFLFDNMPVSNSVIDDFAYATGTYGIHVQSVPEPAPLVALGIGALGLVARRRRK
jgi:hypothetical protein